jgi:hypothetical protein
MTETWEALYIVLLINGVHTLVDVVIVDPTQVDLISWATISCGVATLVVTQANDGFYWDRFSTDIFFPLVVKVFRCLH